MILKTRDGRSHVVKNLKEAAQQSRLVYQPGEILDEGEVIATTNKFGVVRDLDSKIVVLP